MISNAVIARRRKRRGGVLSAVTYSQDVGTESSSAYEIKGNHYTANANRRLTAMTMHTETASQTVWVLVARIDETEVIQEILVYGQEFTTVSGANEVTLASPISLYAGNIYTFAFVRQDAGALNINSDSSPNTDPSGFFTKVSGTVARHDIAQAVVGGDLTFASSAAWSIDITTVGGSPEPVAETVTFDSSSDTFDSNTITFDEAA